MHTKRVCYVWKKGKNSKSFPIFLQLFNLNYWYITSCICVYLTEVLKSVIIPEKLNSHLSCALTPQQKTRKKSNSASKKQLRNWYYCHLLRWTISDKNLRKTSLTNFPKSAKSTLTLSSSHLNCIGECSNQNVLSLMYNF